MPSADLYHEIIERLEQVAATAVSRREKYRRFSETMHKIPGVKSYGLTTPEIHAVRREFRDHFSRLTTEQRLKLGRRLLKNAFEEPKHIGIGLIAMSLHALPPSRFDLLDELMGRCNSWSITDSFSLDVMQPLLERFPARTLALLRQWNRSDHLWKRRASVVTFTRKAGASGHWTEPALALCENLVNDPEDLIRKGVGWALKDLMRGDETRVIEYVKDLRRRGVSSTVTLYAIRDLTGAKRKAVLAIKGPGREGA